MTTINALAAEYNTQPYELRAFADDLLDGLADTDEIPGETEVIVREAWASAPASQSIDSAQENRDLDHAADVIDQVEQESGWLDSGALRIDE